MDNETDNIEHVLNRVRNIMKSEIDKFNLDQLHFLGKVIKNIEEYRKVDEAVLDMLEIWKKKK